MGRPSHANNVIDLTGDRDLFSPSPVNETSQSEVAPPILPSATMADRASVHTASQQLSGSPLAHKNAPKRTNGVGWSPQNQIHTMPERPAKKRKTTGSTQSRNIHTGSPSVILPARKVSTINAGYTQTPRESTQSEAREGASSSISPPPENIKTRFAAVLQNQVFIHITAAMERHQRIIADAKLKEIGKEVYTFTTLILFEADY
jgi:hypothetical protein